MKSENERITCLQTPDAKLTMVDAANDSAKQTGQIENFLAQGMDAVVILPVDTAATGPMTKAVVKAGKPLVYSLRTCPKVSCIVVTIPLNPGS